MKNVCSTEQNLAHRQQNALSTFVICEYVTSTKNKPVYKMKIFSAFKRSETKLATPQQAAMKCSILEASIFTFIELSGVDISEFLVFAINYTK